MWNKSVSYLYVTTKKSYHFIKCAFICYEILSITYIWLWKIFISHYNSIEHKLVKFSLFCILDIPRKIFWSSHNECILQFCMIALYRFFCLIDESVRFFSFPIVASHRTLSLPSSVKWTCPNVMNNSDLDVYNPVCLLKPIGWAIM